MAPVERLGVAVRGVQAERPEFELALLRDELGAAATDYLRIFALTTFGWLWLQIRLANGAEKG